MKQYLFITSVLLSLNLSAQNFEKIFSVTGINTNEYANTAIELSNGNFLIGINNRVLCLAPNGDSLWTKTYINYGDVAKLFFNNANELLLATTKGKMLILKIDPNNGDSIGSITLPNQPSNGGYTIYDMVVLPDGDIIYCYNNGGGFGGIIRRYTPGQTANKWSNDYAGENWAPKNILIDDSTIIVAGYKGTSTYANLIVRKIGINNTPIWNKEMIRNTYYADRKLGIQKNVNGEYLIATSFNMYDILAPTIVKLTANGDSLSSSWVSNYSGHQVNHGYLTSLAPTTGGFIAAGYINYNLLNPVNVIDGLGFMCIFFINNNGIISQAKAYNQVGFYNYSPTGSEFDGAEGWGNGCFSTGNGKYLLYGVGNKIYNPGTGANFNPLWKGYVVQSDSLETVSGNQELSILKTNCFLFPNPFNDKVYLAGKFNNNAVEIFVYDLGGTEVAHQQLKGIDREIHLHQLPNGIYFVKIIESKETLVLKLIKTDE
jgi:hypothetical protein